MPTVRIQEKNYSESIMVLKLKDGYNSKNVAHPKGLQHILVWYKKS